MTASSIGWTPLFLSAEPVRTGMILVVSVPRRRPRLISAIGQLLALEVLVGELVVHLGDGLDHRVAVLLGLGSSSSAGMSTTSILLPRSSR